MRYFLSVGEASGDLHAANLMKAIRAKDPEAQFSFTGGDLMARVAGHPPIVHYREMAFMGFLPVIMHLGTIRRAASQVHDALRSFNPHIVIAVDYAGFNLRYLLPYAKEELGLPTAYYILPKVWAWKKYRLGKIRQYTDLPLSILPFEPTFFRANGYDVPYVGNPCLDAVSTAWHDSSFTASLLSGHRPLVAVLAGSRRQEVKANLPVMLQAVSRFADCTPIIVGAPGLTYADYEPHLSEINLGRNGTKPQVIFGHTYSLLTQARLALVTSGTATLETALIGCPQIVCYNMRGGRVANYLFDYFLSVRYFSLANLIADAPIVPELLAAQCTVDNIASHLAILLCDGESRTAQLDGYKRIKQLIGTQNCSTQAAQKIYTVALDFAKG